VEADLKASLLQLGVDVQPYPQIAFKLTQEHVVGYSPIQIGIKGQSVPSAALFRVSKAGRRKVAGDNFEFSVADPPKQIPSQGAVPLEIPWKSQTIRDDFRKFGVQLRLSLVPRKNVNKIYVFGKKSFIIHLSFIGA
jgi:hypothetical protein